MKKVPRQRSDRAAPRGIDARGRVRHSRRAAAALARHGTPPGELIKLRACLADAEATLRAIRNGEVDAVMVAGKQGPHVFTLEGAEHVYRVLIESMNEGALTLTADQTILYANQCFARMVQYPLERVMGSSFRRFLTAEDRAKLRPLLLPAAKSGVKIQVLLQVRDGSQLPAQVSVRPLTSVEASHATVGMVVTDMTEVRRNEKLLRALTRRVVQVQEAERGRVALELHDHITQLICAVLVRSQVLADQLSARDGPLQQEAITLRDMLGQTAHAVECISRELRPSVLTELGLVAVLRDTTKEFAERTGVALRLACEELAARLPADTELTLYRILQEALRNVEQHAHAHHVTVCLKQQGGFIHLAIDDDGIGFDPDRRRVRRNGTGGLGLLGMRERAGYVGGDLSVKSALGLGTTIRAQIPLVNRTLMGGRRPLADRVHQPKP